jgi:hypothetical protein
VAIRRLTDLAGVIALGCVVTAMVLGSAEDYRLFRRGLLLFAMASGVLLAAIVLSPRGAMTRALEARPLRDVRLGGLGCGGCGRFGVRHRSLRAELSHLLDIGCTLDQTSYNISRLKPPGLVEGSVSLSPISIGSVGDSSGSVPLQEAPSQNSRSRNQGPSGSTGERCGRVITHPLSSSGNRPISP